MKVYVAERIYTHEGFRIIGIFSTKEKAQEACDNDKNDRGELYGDDHDVEEFEIDTVK